MEEEVHPVIIIKDEVPHDGVIKFEVDDEEEIVLFTDPLNDDLPVRQREQSEPNLGNFSPKDETPIHTVSRPIPKTYGNRRKNQSLETSTTSKDLSTGRTESEGKLNPDKNTVISNKASENFVSATIKAEILEDPDIFAEPGSSDVELDVRYMDSADVVHDELLYCLECLCAYAGDCPKHGALIIIPDTPILDNEADEFRALKTAPLQVIITDSKIPNAGRGVIAREIIPDRARFGPYEGKKVPRKEGTEYAWLIRQDVFSDYCIDASDSSTSNWMRFVNCARSEVDRNLWAFQYQGKVYFRTTRAIRPGEELLVWCGNNYALRLGIDTTAIDADRFRNFLQITRPKTSDSDLTYKERKRIRLEAKKKDIKVRKYFNPPIPKTSLRYISTVCKRRFHNQELLEEHLQAHRERLVFLCNHCFKCFRKRESFDIHLLSHSDERPFGCPLCVKTFTSEREVRFHVLCHCQWNPPVCALCEKRVLQRCEMKYHLREHFGEVFKTYRCTKCDEGFPGEIDLSRHRKLCKNGGLHICSECYRFCWTAMDLNRHLRTHKRERSEGFKCRRCGELFSLFALLERHLKIHNSEVRSYQCDKCEEFMVWKEVKTHVMRCGVGSKT